MTIDDCMRAAWQALLRGDYAERDRFVAIARTLINARARFDSDGSLIDEGQAIKLRDVK